MNSLSQLSNNELESRLKYLVQKERRLLHLILEHIREVDSRKLYLEKAYSSIYDYLIKELGYSGSAAMRRLEAARLLRDIPEVAERIQDGSLNLTQVGEISRAIKEKEKVSGEKISNLQKQALIEIVLGKTTQETQQELAQALDLPLKEYDTQRVQKDESVRLELTLTKEQHEKLLRCKDLAAHILLQEHGSIALADVIEFLANQYLDEKFKRKKASSSATVEDEAMTNLEINFPEAIVTTGAVVKNVEIGESSKETKSVTPKMRRMVFKRDKCCQYVDRTTGKVCGSTFALQVDHKVSKWAGGVNSLMNLQLLCGMHNRAKYYNEKGLKIRS
ncbi:HNH endonuclease [Bdellovibrio reynosensis]|uniref:HNH endonuclease n=1 Tax=Bdellovibrio reynosensis TaxID=2835041 RepID=A0ABY4CAM0_9BACT|nr:HNH endonuclease signature motif containing protein [Bdellovibrio reynosensis]UOF01764.1 HNH endonuclease [Bdellovibrio reynosensis]